jgi:hypothetical protein
LDEKKMNSDDVLNNAYDEIPVQQIGH